MFGHLGVLHTERPERFLMSRQTTTTTTFHSKKKKKKLCFDIYIYSQVAPAACAHRCPSNFVVVAIQSTEDYSVDDWGADFVGGIVLTPKTGGPGSTWGRTQAQETLEECDEDTDDSCAAAFDRSVSLT